MSRRLAEAIHRSTPSRTCLHSTSYQCRSLLPILCDDRVWRGRPRFLALWGFHSSYYMGILFKLDLRFISPSVLRMMWLAHCQFSLQILRATSVTLVLKTIFLRVSSTNNKRNMFLLFCLDVCFEFTRVKNNKPVTIEGCSDKRNASTFGRYKHIYRVIFYIDINLTDH